MSLPPNLAALRDIAMQTSCENWAMRRRWKLSRGLDRSGPCPLCGGDDRFSIHTKKNQFHCRKCDLSGSGVIELVMQTKGLKFVDACELITGRMLEDEVDPEVARKAREKAEADDESRRLQAERYREKARRNGYEIWTHSRRFQDFGEHSAVATYLRLRGLDPERFKSLGINIVHELEAHPYRHEVTKGDWQTLASGPAMALAIQRRDGSFGAVHQTWIDLTRPKGRLVLTAPDGKQLSSKKMLGSKKGGAIRIYTPDNPRRLVVGEGFETTATPLLYDFSPDTAYWAAGDVGNMAGRALRDGAGKQVFDQPDMDDLEAFVPPEWCEELVFLGEGDDGDINTKKLTRGLRRAKRLRPGLTAVLIPAPGPGQDMNDLVRGGCMSSGDEVGLG